jgi:hypothetical protein
MSNMITLALITAVLIGGLLLAFTPSGQHVFAEMGTLEVGGFPP